jgi:hypothetical protein
MAAGDGAPGALIDVIEPAGQAVFMQCTAAIPGHFVALPAFSLPPVIFVHRLS